MGEIRHATDADELYGELRKLLERFFRDYDLIAEGVAVGVHQTDRGISKYVGRTAYYEGDKNPAAFEIFLEKSEPEDLVMIFIHGQRHDYRVYLRGQNVEEAYGKFSVWYVMTS